MRLDQTSKQSRRMIKDFIETRKGHLTNSRMVARDIYEIWGVLVDWHEVASVLDEMNLCGSVEHQSISSDGLINYLVK